MDLCYTNQSQIINCRTENHLQREKAIKQQQITWHKINTYVLLMRITKLTIPNLTYASVECYPINDQVFLMTHAYFQHK
jgi:hypothetical protein